MNYAGSLNYDTRLDTTGFQKGINSIANTAQSGGTKIKNIVSALGITKIISTAISTINNSIDSAISRIDTLNNFPKVMSNLGISSKESTKTINKLSDNLKGIPTTLDSAALAVQRFTSANEDIEKSTDIFLAVNNAILAGGASADIQASALEQLSQAYAKGKPDMVEWRSIQTAMPAQLKQVADVMEMTSDELGESLRKGDISMDEFIDTIVDLNKNGGKGIKSFAEQARNATGGIKTNITNMKTAVSRGVANIIDSFDKALKKDGLGGLGTVISKIGSEAEKVLKKVSTAVSKINVSKLLNTLKTLIPIIASVVAGFAAYEMSLKAIQAINMAKKIASTASAFLAMIPNITSANVAMVALNTTLSISPIGIVVGTVAALTAGLVLLNKATSDSANEQTKVSQTLNEYKNSMQEADKERQQYLDTNMNEIKGYQDLAAELDMLVDKNGKVKEGYEKRAEFIVDQLNEALGTEIKMNDGVIEKYDEVKKSIDEIIQSKRAKILLEAEEKKYNEAKDQQAKIEENYTNAYKQHNSAVAERTKFLNELREKYGLTTEQVKQFAQTGTYVDENGKVVNMRLDEEYQKLCSLDAQYNSTKNRLEEVGNAYANNQAVIGNYEIALQKLSEGNYQAVLKMYEDTTNYQGKTNEETYKNYETGIQAQQQYLDDLRQGKYTFNAEARQAEIQKTKETIENLQNEQAQYKSIVAEGQKNAKEEWKKGLSNQLSEITGHTVEFKTTSKGQIQAYIDGVKEGKPMSKKEAEKFGEDMVKEIDKAKIDSKIAGKNIIDGTTEGINNRNSQNSAFSSISSFGSSLLSKLKLSLKEHSPSKASEEDAKFLLDGFNNGIDKNKDNVYKNIELFGDDIISRMENAINVETGKMSFSGTNASVNQILSANASFVGTIPLKVDLDGEKIYENQQTIRTRKELQYGGTK